MNLSQGQSLGNINDDIGYNRTESSIVECNQNRSEPCLFLIGEPPVYDYTTDIYMVFGPSCYSRELTSTEEGFVNGNYSQRSDCGGSNQVNLSPQFNATNNIYWNNGNIYPSIGEYGSSSQTDSNYLGQMSELPGNYQISHRPTQIDPSISLREQIERYIPVGWEDEFKKYKHFLVRAAEVLERPEYQRRIPADHEIFSCLHYIPKRNVRVMIIGQSPFPGMNSDGSTVARGISFCGRPGKPIPASTRKIYQELDKQIPGLRPHKDGDITAWCAQGVLLINRMFTFHPDHLKKDDLDFWKGFVTKIIIECILANPGLIIVCWGEKAKLLVAEQEVSKHIQGKVVKLEAGHPSPNNRYDTFSGKEHFITINRIFAERGEPLIDWNTH